MVNQPTHRQMTVGGPRPPLSDYVITSGSRDLRDLEVTSGIKDSTVDGSKNFK